MSGAGPSAGRPPSDGPGHSGCPECVLRIDSCDARPLCSAQIVGFGVIYYI